MRNLTFLTSSNPFQELRSILANHSIISFPKDSEISQWKSNSDMESWIAQQKEPKDYLKKFNFASSHFLKGIPRWELFSNLSSSNLPPNLSLYNYRKPKWSDTDNDNFLKKSLYNFNKYMQN